MAAGGQITAEVVREFEELLGKRWVRSALRDRLTYSYDATAEKHLPGLVLFPGSAEEVAAAMRLAARYSLPVVPRGAGTNVSGGTIPTTGGVVMAMQRLNRILSIDTVSRRAVVEPCVANLAVQEALAPHGLFFPPDPSSHKVSTIGGNCQENSGGPHCVKYGVAVNHIRGVELVLPDGEIVTVGGEAEGYPGLDLTALVVGSEGTLGIVTKVILNVIPLPEATSTILAVFDDLESCVRSVSEIIAARIVPAALELIDNPFINVIQDSMDAGLPRDAAGALVIEVDGPPEGLGAQAEQIAAICRRNGVRAVSVASDEAERNALWQGRRAAYACLARKSSFLWTMDITVPRGRLVEMMRRVLAVGERHGLEIYTVAHAGDGNLHPIIPFRPSDPAEKARVRAADREILEACVDLGGSITGEHGIGVDKVEQTALMFRPAELALMNRVKLAFDPQGLMNPGKKIPLRTGGV
ncbi:MAG: FAD-binding oxidoreductase [Bacillota bacterium]